MSDFVSRKLHLGCGRKLLAGWINLDARPAPGVDLVADLDDLARVPLPLADHSIDQFLAAHLIEHLHHPLAFMEELYRVAAPDAIAEFHLPFGSSDDAYEDPTHVRPYFLNSFNFFSQPAYRRADYGYRGDWQPLRIRLSVEKPRYEHLTRPEIMDAVYTLRNVVLEMKVYCQAIKPARDSQTQALVWPKYEVVLRSRGGLEELVPE